MDANFKLKLQKGKTKRSNYDPELEPGWCVMVEEKGYQLLVKKWGKTKDVSALVLLVLPTTNASLEDDVPSCGPKFHAVNHAHSRGGHGDLSVSGVGAITCGRHNFVLAMADLQQGEQ
jgi:hypothetical protein